MNGDIWFAYHTIPVEIMSIKVLWFYEIIKLTFLTFVLHNYGSHKLLFSGRGASCQSGTFWRLHHWPDSLLWEKARLCHIRLIKIYFSVARRKTIYEYHRLNMKNQEIKNKTAIIFNALQTCNTNTDCGSCLAVQQVLFIDDWCFWLVKGRQSVSLWPVASSLMCDVQAGEETGRAALHCRWCAPLARCSDGTDRNRQDWLKQKCDSHNISQAGHCPRPGQVTPLNNIAQHRL